MCSAPPLLTQSCLQSALLLFNFTVTVSKTEFIYLFLNLKKIKIPFNSNSPHSFYHLYNTLWNHAHHRLSTTRVQLFAKSETILSAAWTCFNTLQGVAFATTVFSCFSDWTAWSWAWLPRTHAPNYRQDWIEGFIGTGISKTLTRLKLKITILITTADSNRTGIDGESAGSERDDARLTNQPWWHKGSIHPPSGEYWRGGLGD